MAVKIFSATTLGLEAFPVEVEVDTAPGLYSFKIVGLPDKSIEEAKERVASAIKNSGFSSPSRHNRKIVINLAPADIQKEGAGFDLPIAVGVLLAMEELKPLTDLSSTLFIGELGLDGTLRKIPGALPIAEMAKKELFDSVILPKSNYREAAVIKGIKIVPLETLQELVHFLEGRTEPALPESNGVGEQKETEGPEFDFSDIQGLEQAKRCLEIAAAGGHNVLLAGFPGTGKTLLARAFPGILPGMTLQESIEVTKIYSVAGYLESGGLIIKRPFRAPHHTASGIAIVGGGSWPRPGEVSLAHRGVLFLDEFPEFARSVIENLRQPMEEGWITVSRARGAIKFPARFTMITAMNPCPCGWYGDSRRQCTCTLAKIVQYRQKISGPILDRIDLYVEVPRIPYETLSSERKPESSAEIQKRVGASRLIQEKRFAKLSGKRLFSNAEMRGKDLGLFAPLSKALNSLLKQAADTFSLSPRSIHRTIKVSRTIADLADSEEIKETHLAEALQYRPKEEITGIL